jgi:hypothetical protein
MAAKPVNPNPFAGPDETRDITLTFRVTPAEHDALVTLVGTKRGAINKLIREGLALAIDARQQQQQQQQQQQRRRSK